VTELVYDCTAETGGIEIGKGYIAQDIEDVDIVFPSNCPSLTHVHHSNVNQIDVSSFPPI
jgi:hypothetical protein